jgi:serine/threonine-protein kinase
LKTFFALLKKWLFRLSLVGLGIFVFGIVAVLTAWFYLKNQVHQKEVFIPDLYGLTPEAARQAIEDADLVLEVDPSQDIFSEVIEKGHVLLQVPRPGRKVKAGRVVEISLSAGPEEHVVPDVLGQTLTFANTLLSRTDNNAAIITRIPSSVGERGQIIAQHPKPNQQMGLRQGVSLLVSDGKPQQVYVMPDLVGRDYAVVKTFLDGYNIPIVTKYRESGDLLGPVILEQSPIAGYPLTADQHVTLLVNKDF